VVTNAGITGGAPAEEYDFEEWKKMLDVNVNGTFLISREAGRYWLENKRKGVIMMVSSMSGSIVNVPQKQSAYNTVCISHPSAQRCVDVSIRLTDADICNSRKPLQLI